MPRGEERGEGIVREFGINMYTLPYLKWITNKVLLYTTGKSAQCYVAAWMGGEFEGYIYVYTHMYAIHVCILYIYVYTYMYVYYTCMYTIHMCIVELLCYTPETITTLLLSYTSI